MPETIYFQWQNKYLLDTIYPVRNRKLADFLLAFYEIDTWAQYKNKSVQELSNEINKYCDRQRATLTEALDTFRQMEAYFLDPDVADEYRAAFPSVDPLVMVKINDMHALFKRYFPTYQNPVKEKYFLSERMRGFEDLYKRTRIDISEIKRKLRNMGPTWTKKADNEREQARLENVALPMIDRELKKLKAFLAAYERMSRYRQELIKRKLQRQKDRETSQARIPALRSEAERLQKQSAGLQQQLRRMTTPPNYDQVRGYFLTKDVTEMYRQRFTHTDDDTLGKINNLHADFARFFPTYQSPKQEKFFLDRTLQELRETYKRKSQQLADRERALTWPGISPQGRAGYQQEVNLLRAAVLPMLEEELSKLEDLQWAFDLRSQPVANLPAQIAQKQKERNDLQARLQKLQSELQGHETVIRQADEADRVDEREQLLAMVDPRQVTVKDVVRDLIDSYQAELYTKSHQELLELVVKAFMENPQRYPLWLQYMVIHFSGMRYQSAHGSWADPRGLLLSLRIRDVDASLRALKMDGVKAEAEQRRLMYQSARERSKVLGSAPGEEHNLPALTQCGEKKWQEKVEMHLRHLDPGHWHSKSKALLDLRIDEETYEIEKMTDRQVLDELVELKDDLPQWMWNEIVRVTELRLTEVVDANWEELSADDLEKRNAVQMGNFRVILNKWKTENLTGWREAHDRSSKLVVSRAVCNEVAEHCQHIRGLTPPGGLTAKPDWYRRKEKDVLKAPAPAGEQAYLIKPQSAADFKPGASILWIAWVHKMPNPWQVAKPLALQSGEVLLADMRDALNDVRNMGDHYQRTVTLQEKDAAGNVATRTSVQYLRWLHEATVVEAADTVDGPVVFTFETALPTDDKRQATIGVFRHMASNLRHQASPGALTGTFVGYMPPGQPDFDQLEEMLNWNHILQREAYTGEQIETYWQKVGRPVGQSFALGMEGMDHFRAETRVEVAPRLRPNHAPQAIHCFEIEAGSGAASRYEPEVSLPRGTRLIVCKDEAERIDGELYYPVVNCEDEPRADNLYLRAADVIETGEGDATRAMVTRQDISLYMMSGADGRAQPIFETKPMTLVSGTPVYVSSVHCTGPTARQDGAMRAKNGQLFYLIVDCPRKPSAAGWFVRKKDLRALTVRRKK